MIRQLWIQNYAIIDEVDLRFSSQLTTITGETGAGKSIIMGALGLILGERADTKVLYNQDKKCIVEGTFDIDHYDLQPFFELNELDYHPECIVRREIKPNGKSRAFINDTPTRLNVLKDLSQFIIDLHRQFDTLDIHQLSFQFKTLDALAGQQDAVKKYQLKYKQLVKLREQLEQLKADQQQRAREEEFLKFQLNELETVDYKMGEWYELEQSLERMSHVEELKTAYQSATNWILESEPSVSGMLSDLIVKFEHAGSAAENLLNRIREAQIELDDIAREAELATEDIDYQPKEQEEVEERMQDIHTLQQKHKLDSADALIALREEFSQSLEQLEHSSSQIQNLEADIASTKNEALELARTLSNNRISVIPQFQQEVALRLQQVSMPDAVFEVDLQETQELNPAGKDQVDFRFSANKGAPTGKIKDVASGGELSRLALAIKSIVAAAIPLPTLMFDEIDSGVSGDVALKMGGILKKLSREHQVIVITHSPQISAQGDIHYFVYKETDSKRTFTRVKALEGELRTQAIATMLSSDPPTPAALANAKELLHHEN
jgi:DNA repair protein RecN (Recombination protein N)